MLGYLHHSLRDAWLLSSVKEGNAGQNKGQPGASTLGGGAIGDLPFRLLKNVFEVSSLNMFLFTLTPCKTMCLWCHKQLNFGGEKGSERSMGSALPVP